MQYGQHRTKFKPNKHPLKYYSNQFLLVEYHLTEEENIPPSMHGWEEENQHSRFLSLSCKSICPFLMQHRMGPPDALCFSILTFPMAEELLTVICTGPATNINCQESVTE